LPDAANLHAACAAVRAILTNPRSADVATAATEADSKSTDRFVEVDRIGLVPVLWQRQPGDRSVVELHGGISLPGKRSGSTTLLPGAPSCAYQLTEDSRNPLESKLVGASRAHLRRSSP